MRAPVKEETLKRLSLFHTFLKDVQQNASEYNGKPLFEMN